MLQKPQKKIRISTDDQIIHPNLDRRTQEGMEEQPQLDTPPHEAKPHLTAETAVVQLPLPKPSHGSDFTDLTPTDHTKHNSRADGEMKPSPSPTDNPTPPLDKQRSKQTYTNVKSPGKQQPMKDTTPSAPDKCQKISVFRLESDVSSNDIHLKTTSLALTPSAKQQPSPEHSNDHGVNHPDQTPDDSRSATTSNRKSEKTDSSHVEHPLPEKTPESLSSQGISTLDQPTPSSSHDSTPEEHQECLDSSEKATAPNVLVNSSIPPRTSARRKNDDRKARRESFKQPMPPDTILTEVIDESAPPHTDQESPLSPDTSTLLSSSISMPPMIYHGLLGSVLCLASLAMFFIIVETASFLSSIQNLPFWTTVFLSLAFLLFGGTILWYGYKTLRFCWYLKKSPQISIQALQELSKRQDLRKESQTCNREAMTKLADYLTKDVPVNREFLQRLQVTPQTVDGLTKARERLIEDAQNPPGTTLDWIQSFIQQYQKTVDEIALKRIKHYAVQTAWLTAISPFALIDRLISLTASLTMLKELLELYGLRPSWDKNLMLMGNVIINTYLAGILDDIAEEGVDTLADLAGETAENIPGLALRASGKLAETAAQGYMVFRLGRTAMKLLKPISTREDRSTLQKMLSFTQKSITKHFT